MVNYNIKTENAKKYQFGNQLNYGSTLFYLRLENGTAGSKLVLHGEVYETNKQHGEEVVNTAGDILLASLALKGKDKFSVGLTHASHQSKFIKWQYRS
jgi:hypothetical protein